MKTGENAIFLGLYATNCCGEELIFDTDDNLLRCPRCGTRCEWELQEALVPVSELDLMAA